MEIAVLLGHFGAIRESDVYAARCDVRDARTEMAHQPLESEARPNAFLHLGACLCLLTLVIHCAP